MHLSLDSVDSCTFGRHLEINKNIHDPKSSDKEDVPFLKWIYYTRSKETKNKNYYGEESIYQDIFRISPFKEIIENVLIQNKHLQPFAFSAS